MTTRDIHEGEIKDKVEFFLNNNLSTFKIWNWGDAYKNIKIYWSVLVAQNQRFEEHIMKLLTKLCFKLKHSLVSKKTIKQK